MKKLEEFLKPTQDELFKKLSGMYTGAVGVVGSFILVQGEASIMLVAHLDTVYKKPVRDICTSADGNILMSSQGIGGDDRCGVYAPVKTYEQSANTPQRQKRRIQHLKNISRAKDLKRLAALSQTFRLLLLL